jgi:hypothetical protein
VGCRRWLGAIAISKVSTMNSLGSLVDWVIAKGISSNNIEEILEGVSLRLIALGLPLLQTSIAMPSIDPAHRGALAIWSRAKGTSTEITAHGNAGQQVQGFPRFSGCASGYLVRFVSHRRLRS